MREATQFVKNDADEWSLGHYSVPPRIPTQSLGLLTSTCYSFSGRRAAVGPQSPISQIVVHQPQPQREDCQMLQVVITKDSSLLIMPGRGSSFKHL